MRTGHGDAHQPFQDIETRTTEKGSGDDHMETLRHIALARLCQQESITRASTSA